jgi:pimeloyl-ACP methyl ester carboxylesterase
MSVNANPYTNRIDEPCILIPGIAGTTLVDSNTVDFDTLFAFPNMITPLQNTALDMDPAIDYDFKTLVERNHVEKLAYKHFVDAVGQKLDSHLYIFGYDWRQSNLENGRRFIAFVDRILQKLGSRTVNIVTHSMGCLVLSGAFREGLDESKVNKIVFAAPPFLGSLDVYDVIVRGKNFPVISPDHPHERVRKIARTFPAVFELCAVFEGAMKYSDGSAWDVTNWENWQKNLFRDREKSDPQFDSNITKDRIARLKDVREGKYLYDLSKLGERLRKDTLILGGTGAKTAYGMQVVKDKDPGNYFDFDNISEDNDGDGRVPRKSWEAFKDAITTLAVKTTGIMPHAFFMSNETVMTLVTRFLTDSDVDTAERKWHGTIAGDVEEVS